MPFAPRVAGLLRPGTFWIMTATDERAKPAGRTFFGQPMALANLFGVEMWERFSFYGMQGILAYYLYYSATEGGLGMDKAVATSLVGAYGGLVYLSTIFGAWIADRLIGSERTLFYSAILIMLGHIGLALLPGFSGVIVGLLCVGVGSGGLKANATAIVGTLYTPEDPRRDAGFSLFYLGINLGAFFGPLLTGIAQQKWGFHAGFALAAIGMAFGLIQYSLGRKRLPDESRIVHNPLPSSKYPMAIGIGVAGVVVILILAWTGVLAPGNLANLLVWVVLAASIAYFVVILRSAKITPDERSRVVSFIPMFAANAAFWSLYQQQFTVVAVYADTKLDRNLFGWEMPPSAVNSINPIFVIVLAGVFAALWTKLGDRQPITPIKFALGNAVMGVAFLMFLPVANDAANSSPLWWLVLILLVFTIAELLISPVGLSLVTKLAPEAFKAQMVALYFLSVSLGTTMSGVLSTWYDSTSEAGNAGIYFGVLGAASIVVGVVLALFAKPIHVLMRGVR